MDPATFYREHARLVLGWCIRLGGPHLDPEDCAQEVFEVALKRLDSFRGESRITTWLYGITRRVLANKRRRASFRKVLGLDQIAEPVSPVQTDEEAARLRRRRAVQYALERLRDDHREVVVLCDLEGRTAPEVTAMLGIPVGTVYSRLHAARRALRDAIEAEGIGVDDDNSLLLRSCG